MSQINSIPHVNSGCLLPATPSAAEDLGMIASMKKVRQAASLVETLVKHPGQAKYVHRLVQSRGKSTLTLRTLWLPYRAIDFLENQVNPESRVLEFGGGGSTAWFVDRVQEVVTVESDEEWAEMIRDETASSTKIELLLRPPADHYAAYVEAADAYPDESFDVILVDGRERVECVKRSVGKLKPGGLMILDDSDRPKYKEVYAVLQTWNSDHFYGLVPCKDVTGNTTIWEKPGVSKTVLGQGHTR